MPEYPTVEEITAKLAVYVDVDMTDTSADPEYVADCAEQAVDWLNHAIIDAITEVPVSAYERAALEVGAQYFRRRRSWGNIDALDAPAVPPVRSNPQSAAYPILSPYMPVVIA